MKRNSVLDNTVTIIQNLNASSSPILDRIEDILSGPKKLEKLKILEDEVTNNQLFIFSAVNYIIFCFVILIC